MSFLSSLIMAFYKRSDRCKAFRRSWIAVSELSGASAFARLPMHQ